MNELLNSCEAIFDCLSDGVYVCDRERKIVFWSKSAERITGWKAGEVLGRHCVDDVLAHVDKDGHRLCGEEYCPLHRSMITGVTTQVPIIVFARGRDGNRIPMQVTTAPLRDAAGEVVGGVETFREVSSMLVDLERAKRIQSQTLELDLPQDPRVRFATFYMPCDIVGGDYYGVKQLDDDCWGFLLADLEGHGTAAAMNTMHLSFLWHRHYQLLRNPAEFATAINDELARVFGSIVTFATAVCGVIDVRAGTLRLSRAGGPLPLIIHPDWTVERPEFSGPPLGVMEDVAYLEQTVQLRPGDAVLIFSDGVFEIQNARQEWLGVDGLVRILKSLGYPQVDLSMNALEEKLLKFSNDIRLQDDVSIIEIRFSGGQR